MMSVLLAVLLVGAALTSCGGAENPNRPGATDLVVAASGAAWVAYRDGEGAWQVLEGEERYVLELGHPGGRYSVAHVCATGLGEAGEEGAREVSVSLLHATLSARPSVATPCADEPGESETEADFYALTGAVNGLAAGETGLVYSEFLADAVTADAPDYSLAGFTAGEYDLLVTVQRTPDAPEPSEWTPPSKVLVRQGVAVAGDETLNLDLSQALPTTTKRVSVEDVPLGGEVSSSLSLTTERGTSATLGAFSAEELEKSPFSFDYAALQTLPEGAVYHLSAERFSEDEQGQRLSTSLERTFATPEDLTLGLPEALGTAELSLDGGRPTLSWEAYREGADYRVVFENSSDDAGETRYLITLDAAWLPPSASTLSYTPPNLSEVPGWNDAWGLSADLFWTLDARAERENEVVVVSRSSAIPETASD